MVFGPAPAALVASLGLAVAFTTGSHSSPAAARVGRAAAPRVVRSRHAPRIRLGSDTSTNWSGYAVTGSNFTDVKGSWTVPSIDSSQCAGGYSAAWVGIDGDNSNTVEQCGTEQDANGQFYAWYEMYPKGSVYVAAVAAGHQITAEVQYQSNGGKFVLTLRDNKTLILNTSQKLPQARRSSAEWIMEAPWSGGTLPLADFVSIGFTGCQVAVGSSSPVGLSSFGSTAEMITMVSTSGTQLRAQPSSPVGGDAFTVFWRSCQ